MIYIISFTFSIIIDILFYNDKTMRKLIEDNGTFNLKYRLPRIIILFIVGEVFSKLFEKLIDYQGNLIDLKKNLELIDEENNSSKNDNSKKNNNNNINIVSAISQNYQNSQNSTDRKTNRKLKENKSCILINNKLKFSDNKEDDRKDSIQINYANTDNNNQIENTNDNNRSKKTKETKEEMARKIKKSFRRNRIIFYIIILIFQLFSWYFISSFCALYKKTQKHLGMDIGIGIGIDLISSLFISFYILIIRIIIIRSSCCNYSIKIFYTNKCLKNNKLLKKILSYINEEVITYIFQKIIELLIAYYIINKIPFLSDF